MDREQDGIDGCDSTPKPKSDAHHQIRETSKLSDLSLRYHHKHNHFHNHQTEQQQQHQYQDYFQMHQSRMKTAPTATATMIMILLIVTLASNSIAQAQWAGSSGQSQQKPASSTDPFPGVSRDLAAFCAARPSLPIDVASMVVHVKRNVSFNYKLYLFSGNHVFQTGQVIPRDEFRIHSFPVKFKKLTEFWSPKVDTFQYNDSRLSSLSRVPSETFNLAQFLKPVPLNIITEASSSSSSSSRASTKSKLKLMREVGSNGQQKAASEPSEAATSHQHHKRLPEDLHGDTLPGDPAPFISHDVARVMEHHREQQQMNHSDDNLHPYNENYNKHIEFDRDDQVSVSKNFRSMASGEDSTDRDQPSRSFSPTAPSPEGSPSSSFGDEIIPVGAFSSFHVNLTYFVRKDFGQLEPELIRVHIDANQFSVSELVLINNGIKNSSNYPQNEDYNFLQHRLIRDPDTRIIAINQIYEDWITRNFYTIVYIQRKLSTINHENDGVGGEMVVGDDEMGHDMEGGSSSSDHELNGRSSSSSSSSSSSRHRKQQVMIISDRLVFRGTSTALLGAEQLDYNVKAAAFITEKNGLHYYLEFLTTGKFYLCAVDWTKRPFRMIDSRRFPIKSTRTQLDNEELLLCPPTICYSDRPVDEIVGYGRISLNNDNNVITDSINNANLAPGSAINDIRSSSSSSNNNSNSNSKALIRSTNDTLNSLAHPPGTGESRDFNWNNTTLNGPRMAEIEGLKLSSKQLETRLHLRDWVWTLPRKTKLQQQQQPLASSLINLSSSTKPPTSMDSGSGIRGTGYGNTRSINSSKTSFEWHYELARRNDIKVKQDTYGYVLTGHEIDASYRIYNELYLISANHLITINYTLINETVTSNQLLGDEFFGLSSTLVDPITGAFYDRYENQIFFFKGDRYIGYNYNTKKPLDDFVLEATLSSMELDPIGINLFSGGPLVSSLPVVGILGRQHEVDGVYHDYFSDFVYIFSGMKFYKFSASEFKNGTFNGQSLPRMQCINEHFLDGCHFDRAFPNPCSSSETVSIGDHEEDRFDELHNMGGHKQHDKPDLENKHRDRPPMLEAGRLELVAGGRRQKASDFFEEQQMKLRSIAAGKPGLLNILKENSMLKTGAPSQTNPTYPEEGAEMNQAEMEEAPAAASAQAKANRPQETLFVYLLITMIVLACLVFILLIFMLIIWSRANQSSHRLYSHPVHPLSPAFVASGNYLSNQREHQSRRAFGTMVDTQQLAYGGRPIVPKPSSCVKVVVNSGGAQDTRSNGSSDSNSIHNSAL